MVKARLDEVKAIQDGVKRYRTLLGLSVAIRVNKGYLSAILAGKKGASKRVRIALGLRPIPRRGADTPLRQFILGIAVPFLESHDRH